MAGQTAAEQAPSGADRADPDELRIVSAIHSGDGKLALTLCVRHHGESLGRLCMALVGSQAEAEDIVQETLLAAHDGFSDYRADGSIRAWLFGIARRKCARHLERRSRREARLRLVHDSSRGDLADELVAKRQRAERARAALDGIRPSEREALVLRYAAELSFREVAAACGIDEAAARKRVSRGLARLREELGGKE